MPRAIVTGAGSGIGRSTAIKLSQMGYTIIGVGRRRWKLEETASLCTAGFEMVCLDLTDREKTLKELGSVTGIRALVANSGVCRRTEIERDGSDAIFDEIMLTNVQGVWNTFRAVTPNLISNASAVVVSSGLGKLARSGYSAYAASKHAVLGLSKCLALELAPRKIRVNGVCPGWVDTEMSIADLVCSANEFGTSREVEYEKACSSIPMGRFVEPDEVANLIGWLVSSESRAITGQSYNISCGEFLV